MATGDDTTLEWVRNHCSVMVKYCVEKGIPIPESAPGYSTQEGAELSRTFNALALAVAPLRPSQLTTPEGVETAKDRTAARRMIRAFAIMAVTSIVGAAVVMALLGSRLALPLSQIGTGDDLDLVRTSVFGDRLLKFAFDLFAAGLGATLAVGAQLQEYSTKSTYRSAYNATYAIKVVIALVAGFVLAELISIPDTTTGNLGALGVGVAALVGGFSARVVYRVLKKLTATIESLFTQSAEEREQTLKVQSDARVEAVVQKAQADHLSTQLQNWAKASHTIDGITDLSAEDRAKLTQALMPAGLEGKGTQPPGTEPGVDKDPA